MDRVTAMGHPPFSNGVVKALRLLYWNTNQKDLSSQISKAAKEFDIDLLVLSEVNMSASALLIALNSSSKWKYGLHISPITETIILSRYPQKAVLSVYDSNGVTIRNVRPPIGIQFLLVAVHLGSKMYLSETEQALLVNEIIRNIARIESEQGHKRSIVIGDFNMNPFEVGMISSETFHATMSSDIATTAGRTVRGHFRDFFYNPMWNFLGDDNKPCGTYFYRKSTPNVFQWNLFDQVLIRPDMIAYYDRGGTRIISQIDTENLLNASGTPNKKRFSDHLPIVVKIDLKEGE